MTVSPKVNGPQQTSASTTSISAQTAVCSDTGAGLPNPDEIALQTRMVQIRMIESEATTTRQAASQMTGSREHAAGLSNPD